MSPKSKKTTSTATAAAAPTSKKAAKKLIEVAESSDDESSASEDNSAILKSLADQFALFNSKMDKMEAKLSDSLEANRKLQNELREKTKVIEDLQSSYSGLENKLNNMEQYNRSWSVRISNVPLSNEEEKSPILLREKVYQLVFLPILSGAVASGELPCIPLACDLLEMVHILPSKPGTHKPIIVRFRDRILRSTCLRLKKSFATRSGGVGLAVVGEPGVEPGGSRGSGSGGARGGGGGSRSSVGGGGGGSRPGELGRFTFPFHEDMTALNYKKMKAIGADERVAGCWSINGQLRYRLVVKPDETRRVVSVFDPIETILGPS